MTKYICECLDGAGKCTHETPSFSAPTLYCVRAHATCHWRAAEEQKPELPEWCKIGAWVWNDEIGYGKIEQEPRTGELLVFFGGGTRAFEAERYKEARLRPWTYEEAPETLKAIDKYEPDRIVCLFLASRNKHSVQYTTLPAWYIDVKILMDKYLQLDGSPCGVLEHYENGEWVE